MMRRIVLAATLAGSVHLPLQAQELGRLFFTPAERDELDERRRAKIADKPQAQVVISPKTRVDGQVVRSGGPTTVWLNRQPIAEGVKLEGVSAETDPRQPGRVAVTVGEGQQASDVKVGQTIERDTGKVDDSLGSGGVSITGPGRRTR